MSTARAGEGKVVVSLDALIAQLEDLRNYVGALRAQINQLVSELAEVRSGENVISELRFRTLEEVLTPADRRGHVMLRVRPLIKDSVIIHIGGGYYAELPFEKAIEILLSKEKELSNVITQLRKELSKAVTYHDQLQTLVNSLIAQARQQAKGVVK